MKYVRDGDGPTIQFRKIQEKVFLHYKRTNTWPDEVFVGGKVRFTGTKPQWNFIQGRVVFFKLDQIKLRISADTPGLEKALSLLSQTMNETSR